MFGIYSATKRFFLLERDLIKKYIKKMFMVICRCFPINPKKVVFSSYFGEKYNDNPRAIFLEMKKRHPNWNYIWLLDNPKIRINNATVVIPNSFSAIFHLATSKVWIDNCRKEWWISKRKKQYYVQTWHGNVAIKKVEKDVENNLSKDYIKNAKNDSKMANLFLSGTKWRTKNYRDSFWYDGEILELGYPYSDVLYKNKNTVKKKVCNYFSLPTTTKLCVYAPTFRKDHNLECYDMDYNRVLAALEKRWEGKWKMLLRLHPNVYYKHRDMVYSKDVIDASDYKEMAELAKGADFIISDYSSTLIDAVEANDFGLIYASDYDNYMKDRSLYFKKNELPYIFCENNEELINEILHFSEEKCMSKVKAFYNDKGFFNDEFSTKRVVSYILKKIKTI